MWNELFSFFLFVLSLLSFFFYLISFPSLSTSSKILLQFSWLKAISDGTIIGKGDIFGGLNGFYIAGIDKEVIKYIDCKDLTHFCDVCGQISSSIAVLLVLSVIFSLISTITCLITICYPSNEKKRSIFLFITTILGLIVAIQFNSCYKGFQTSKGVESHIQLEKPFYCLLCGIIGSFLVFIGSIVLKLAEKYDLCTSRAGTIYATNEDFELPDVKKKGDEEEPFENFD